MGAPAALLACLFFTLLLSEAATAGAETVKLTTTPIFPQIPRGQTSKDFQVLVRVEAPPAAGHRGRVPVDLTVVLNVGGGTASLDSVKKAVLFIITQLRDDDRLAVLGPSGNRLFGEAFLTSVMPGSMPETRWTSCSPVPVMAMLSKPLA
ncbi:hypothetical protein C2845_PM17G04430 [Panicum miliaceum]|uniref:Uncharacterized protein n=1 Tax=Panicum miliaceum TaxID=4540 RepID=A0A3L6Q3M1_PANMI|nr:hypothetical protein C2845_PM17G04430 [Panicum miliaceum]